MYEDGVVGEVDGDWTLFVEMGFFASGIDVRSSILFTERYIFYLSNGILTRDE